MKTKALIATSTLSTRNGKVLQLPYCFGLEN